jgi:transposase, IS30 family
MSNSRPLEGFTKPGLPLSVYEREQIFAQLVADRNTPWVTLARAIDRRHGSTIMREVIANGGRHEYSPAAATMAATRNRCRPKTRRSSDITVRNFATPFLQQGFSPWAVASLAANNGIDVCHQTLYSAIYSGVWENVTSQACLRSRRARPKQRHSTPKPSAIGPNAPRITDRPDTANNRVEAGHFEGDLIIGAGKSQQ